MMYGKNKGVCQIMHWIKPGSVGIEVGVWRGDSSALFLERCSHLHLVDPWSVDAYRGENEHGSFQAYLDRYQKLTGATDAAGFQAYYDKVYAKVCERFKDKPVTIHRQTSQAFFAGFQDRVDWIYLDGSHAPVDVYGDLVDSLRVADRVMGDDYGNKPGVVLAVDSFVKNLELDIETVGTQYRIKRAPE